MSDPLIRMTKTDRQFIVKQMAHKRREFEDELRERILAYLNKLIERKKLSPELDEYHQFNLEQKQKQIDKVNAATQVIQSSTAQNSSNVSAATNVLAGSSGALLKAGINYQVESANRTEAEEKIEAARVSLYISKQQDKLAKKVAEILSYRFQFLILRLAGGNHGYILLANIMADAIESLALNKLRGKQNRVEALIDAAIPQSDSLHYKGWFDIKNFSVLKTLDIDPKVNEVVQRVGPAVRTLIGKYKEELTYQIVDVLNHPFIINGKGEILSGSKTKHNKAWLLDGSNDLPVLLLAPNEKPSQLGFDHGSYVTGQVLEREQVIAQLRFVPNFYKEEIEYSIDINPSHDPYDDSDSLAELVFPGEQHECPWSPQRDILWEQRNKCIFDETSSKHSVIDPIIELDIKGLERRETAYLFDARQAKINLESALEETRQAFNEISSASKSVEEKQYKQFGALSAAHNVTLAARQLIRATKKITNKDSALIKESYFYQAKEALCIANDTLETTRNEPLSEFKNQSKMQAILAMEQEIYAQWVKHIKLSHSVLNEVIKTAAQRQEPTLVKRFVYNQKGRIYDLTKALIQQAEADDAIAYNLIEQLKSMTEHSQHNVINDPPLSLYEEASEAEDIEEDNDADRSSAQSAAEESHEEFKSNAQEARQTTLFPLSPQPIKYINSLIDIMAKIDSHERQEKYSVKNKLLKIESYRNDIEKSYHAILTFLQIDTFENGLVSYLGTPVQLTHSELVIVQKAFDALKSANEAKTKADPQRERARKISNIRHRSVARNIIKTAETTLILAREKIIYCISELESNFKTEDKEHFNAARISAVNRNFKILINQIFPVNSKIKMPEGIRENLSSLNLITKQYEHKINKENLLAAVTLYQKAHKKIKLMGPGAYSLSNAFEYAQLLRQAKENIIHTITGTIASSISIASQAESTKLTTAQIKKDAKTVKQNIHNLISSCISSINIEQDDTLCHNSIESVTDYDEASTKIEELINGLAENTSIPVNIASFPRSTRRQSKSMDPFEPTVHAKIMNIILIAANSETIVNDGFIETTIEIQQKIISLVIEKLEEKKMHLDIERCALNWELWALSVASEAIIDYSESRLTASLSTKKSISLEGLVSKLSIKIMETKQEILSTYQELCLSDSFPHLKKEEPLTSSPELVKDKLKWASTLNHMEQKWVERNQNMTSQLIDLIKKPKKYSAEQTLEYKKFDPIKLIRHQLLINRNASIEKRKVLLNQFKKCFEMLGCIRREIAYENILDKDKEAKNKDISTLINALDKLLRDKISFIECSIENINEFKANLSTDFEKKRVYFRDWKYKTPLPLESNARLKAITDATIEKAKQKKATLIVSPLEAETKEMTYDVNKDIQHLSLEDIKNLMTELRKKVNNRALETEEMPSPLSRSRQNLSHFSPSSRSKKDELNVKKKGLEEKEGAVSKKKFDRSILFTPNLTVNTPLFFAPIKTPLNQEKEPPRLNRTQSF